MNRFCMYYSSEWSVRYSVGPCKVIRKDKEGRVRVALSCGRRMWLLACQVFKTSTEAHDAAMMAHGVNAWA